MDPDTCDLYELPIVNHKNHRVIQLRLEKCDSHSHLHWWQVFFCNLQRGLQLLFFHVLWRLGSNGDQSRASREQVESSCYVETSTCTWGPQKVVENREWPRANRDHWVLISMYITLHARIFEYDGSVFLICWSSKLLKYFMACNGLLAPTCPTDSPVLSKDMPRRHRPSKSRRIFFGLL